MGKILLSLDVEVSTSRLRSSRLTQVRACSRQGPGGKLVTCHLQFGGSRTWEVP